MADVELVIKIPEEDYESIKDDVKKFLSMPSHKVPSLYKAINEGISLPKGHGRLFILDEEIAKKYFVNFSFSSQDWISEVDISKATLKIIKADKDGE